MNQIYLFHHSLIYMQLFLYHNHGGKKRAFVRVELSKMSIPDQVDLLRKAMKSLPIVRMCIDGTGLGIGVVDYLVKEFSDRIESVEFTNQMKEVLAMNLHHDFELGVWELPADQELHRQIHAIQKTPTSGGHFRFDGGRDIHGHQDSLWAMALARHAGESKRVNQHSRFYSGIKDSAGDLHKLFHGNLCICMFCVCDRLLHSDYSRDHYETQIHIQ